MVKRCILLSCPCPHVRSLSSCDLQPRSRRLPSKLGIPVRSNTTLPPHRFCQDVAASTSCCSPSWSLRALRRFLAVAATCVPAWLSLRSHTRWGYLPSSAASSGFRNPSTLSSASCRPALFRAGTVHGLPYLRSLLPERSPDDLSVLGVLLAVVTLARDGFEDLGIAPVRCGRFTCLALTTLAPPLAVPPLRGFDLHGLA